MPTSESSYGELVELTDNQVTKVIEHAIGEPGERQRTIISGRV
jgi:hypothetical protein